MNNNRNSNNNIPPQGSIQPGKVVRIEAYGCFVDLTNYFRLRGLVHISQLANIKVEQVEDVVALDDQVWVKVLQVEETQPPPQVRYKISLSLKDASQDGLATDLGAAAERHQQLKQQITHSLTSSIGMGVALDPMAAAAAARGRKSNLVLKQKGGAPATIINGYALVDDDDDYDDAPNTNTTTSGGGNAANQNINRSGPQVSAADNSRTAATKPMGRGRGTTLPAWMTRQQQEEGPIKAPQDKGKEDEDDDSKGGKHKRKHKHKSSKRHNHRSSRHRSSKLDDDNGDDEKLDNAKDDNSYSEDDDRRKKRKRKHKDHKKSSRHSSRKRRHRSRSRSRSRSPSMSSRSRSRSGSPDRRSRKSSDKEQNFQSVEDAQRLIERLEAKKRQQQK